MPTRYHSESDYENHQRAAQLHDQAAEAHRTAAAHYGENDRGTEREQSRRALEHSRQAYFCAQSVHDDVSSERGYELFENDGTPSPDDDLWKIRAYSDDMPGDVWFSNKEWL